MRSAPRIGLVALASLLFSMLLGGVASAQYAPGAGIQCNTSVVSAGSSFTCTAPGFKVSSTVTVTATGSTTDSAARSASAAGQWDFQTTVTADSEGVASAVIQVPDNATGPASVTFSGVGADDQPRVLANTAAVTVTQAPAGDDADPAPDADDAAADDAAADDALSSTGGDFTTGIVVVAALLAVGTALVVAARRRSTVDA